MASDPISLKKKCSAFIYGTKREAYVTLRKATPSRHAYSFLQMKTGEGMGGDDVSPSPLIYGVNTGI